MSLSRTFSLVKLFQFKNIKIQIEIKFKRNFLLSNKINVSTPAQKAFHGLPIRVGQKWQVSANLEYYYLFPEKGSTSNQEKLFIFTNRFEFLLNPPTNLTKSACLNDHDYIDLSLLIFI